MLATPYTCELRDFNEPEGHPRMPSLLSGHYNTEALGFIEKQHVNAPIYPLVKPLHWKELSRVGYRG